MVARTRGSGHPTSRKLKFNEKLVGKGLSTDVLLKKLKALHAELAELDQELVDVNSLSSVRKELISTSITLHKDRGVKAYAACCLADILRLYAPDAPYTHNELTDIFQFFFKQLQLGLTGADCAYYDEYFHLLESLSTVKSVVLVCDLPKSDDLMSAIFRDFFGIVRRDLPKKIELFMADILIALVDECQSVASDVLEAILAQFMDKNARPSQPAYCLAVQICNVTADKLQRNVCQYFTDVIVSHSPDEDEDFEEVRTAHQLIKQLNRSCPSLLLNVVPQLEEELRVEEVQLRTMATQALGEMFADNGGEDLIRKFPTTWTYWLMRKNDKVAGVRLTFVEAAKGLLTKSSIEVAKAVEDAMKAKLLDPDDKVRAAVCRMYSHVDYETALHHVSEELLKNLADRGLDKKHSVRVEALNTVGRLYDLAYPEIESNEPQALNQFSWIPQTILGMSSVNSEVKAVVEQVLAHYILPLPSSPVASSSKNADVDEVAWTDRLLTTMKFLDDRGKNALLSLSGLKNVRPSFYERYVECCEKNNGGIIDENEETIVRNLNLVVQRIANVLPDPTKASEDLHAFAKLNEGRLYRLLKTCMDTQTDLKGLVKATNEFARRIEQSSSSIAPTLMTIVRRSSLRLINQSSIPSLVRRLRKGPQASEGDDTAQAQAELTVNNVRAVLTYVSKHCPSIYIPHVAELTKAISEEDKPVLVEVCLQALASVAAWDEKVAPNDRRTKDRLINYVLRAGWRHAKFSARLLAHCRDRDELCEDLVNTITNGLSQADEDTLAAHTAVLCEIAQIVPDAFEQKSDVIMAFLIKQVLMVPSPRDPDDMESDEEWLEDQFVTSTIRAKVFSLKICRHRCLAQASSDSAMDVTKPVLNMFGTLLVNGGAFRANNSDDPKIKSRLRLQAAISLLHVATVPAYATGIASHFLQVALMVQDPCFEVRKAFLTKLAMLSQGRRLPPQYNTIPFLAVMDPEQEMKTIAKMYISNSMRTMPAKARLENFELIFIRYLHLLANHPDFSREHEQLTDFAKYIDFYLTLVATAENISLLYHIAMKGKTVRVVDSQKSENLYAVSELAQEIIKVRVGAHSWNLESYPGKIKLPSDILRPLPNSEAGNRVLKTTHLPQETLTWLAKGANIVVLTERKTAVKRRAPAKTNGRTKRPRLGGQRNRNESDEDELESDDTDVSENFPEKEGGDDGSSGPEEPEAETERGGRLGRRARTRAKAKIREQTKRKSRGKENTASSDL